MAAASGIVPPLSRLVTASGAASGAAAFGLAFASGGVVSAALKPGIYSTPTLFPMSQPGVHRYAAGVGLLGEAGPEAVLPLKRGADGKLGVAGGGSGVRVNVHNYAGVQVETRQGSGADEIDILIGQMSERIRRGGNVLSAAIEGSYGLSRGRA
jgi:phage-related minor tail protein